MKQETLVKRLRTLIHTELELLNRYALRNCGVSYEEAWTACDVIKASMKQLRAYRVDTSNLNRQYRNMRKECRDSWGESM